MFIYIYIYIYILNNSEYSVALEKNLNEKGGSFDR